MGEVKPAVMKQFRAGVLLPEHTHIIIIGDDGTFPNNENLPVVIYEHVFQISNEDEAAEEIEKILEDNDWHHPWRNGIYDYHHYHSTAHEVLICYAGDAKVILGGPDGQTVDFKQGDVMILPAGVAHKCEQATADFKCIGAYPLNQMFDIKTGDPMERSKTMDNILKVPLPELDPVYGGDGPLVFHWELSQTVRA